MVNLAPAPAYRQNRHTLRPGMSASYRDLRVWQQGMTLVLAIYKQTRAFPKEEAYGLTSQMRRAAVSKSQAISRRAKVVPRIGTGDCSSAMLAALYSNSKRRS